MIGYSQVAARLQKRFFLHAFAVHLRGLLRGHLWLLLIPLLSACNSADIYYDDRYNPPVYWGRHVVEEGQTLYSIAWRYGRDYRELADANNIDPPYDIYPGEVIRLDLKGDLPANASRSRQTASVSSRPTPASRPASHPQTRSKTKARGNNRLQVSPEVKGNISWRWPHVGPILAKYSVTGQINKGIDIAGEAGDPVHAAADGQVVYAGSGLLGYGKLIIINHNEHYLSAYAHNRSIKVQEGEKIRQGQTIAEMGSTGTNRVKLHFEIRKNGNPVDPMGYLPPR
ncbi:peptidoglycan DD-metalloendopeptidase family protein [Marinobacteraceae bacterium S3BR75-40.1]